MSEPESFGTFFGFIWLVVGFSKACQIASLLVVEHDKNAKKHKRECGSLVLPLLVLVYMGDGRCVQQQNFQEGRVSRSSVQRFLFFTNMPRSLGRLTFPKWISLGA